MISGIYKIQSVIKPERIYIGSAIDINYRWVNHLSDLKCNRHHNPKLQRHYNKYGKDDFKFDVLVSCDGDDLISQEQFFIDSYKPWFNINPFAQNRLGTKHSEETKQKISQGKKGKYDGQNNNFYGKHHSDKTKSLISEHHKKNNVGFAKGYIPWNKGKKLPKEMRDKIVANNPMRGKHHTEETKNKVRETWRRKKIKQDFIID